MPREFADAIISLLVPGGRETHTASVVQFVIGLAILAPAFQASAQTNGSADSGPPFGRFILDDRLLYEHVVDGQGRPDGGRLRNYARLTCGLAARADAPDQAQGQALDRQGMPTLRLTTNAA